MASFKTYDEDDIVLAVVITACITMVIVGLLVIGAYNATVPSVECDLGDNKTLELDVSLDDEFNLPTGADAESVRSCKIHKS